MYTHTTLLDAYGDMDHQGEAAYYATCLHAAVEFIMRLQTTATTTATTATTATTTVITTSTSTIGTSTVTSVTGNSNIDRPSGLGVAKGVGGIGDPLLGMFADGDVSNAMTQSEYEEDRHQVITQADKGLHDLEPELDDLLDDQDQDPASREQEQDEDDQAKQYDDDVVAVARLGEWLREQQTMEDALVLLQQEGWMF